MNKWKLYLLLPLYILLMGAGKAFADYTQTQLASIIASACFTVNPVIKHTPITQLSQDNYAVISGTATCGAISRVISSLTINYYVTGQTDFSTATITTSWMYRQYFSTAILADLSGNPSSFFYKITAVDNMGDQSCWPASGNFYSFNIVYSTSALAAAPQISYGSPVSYVSAINGTVVATGTVTSQAGLASVDLYYSTDANVNLSTYSLSSYHASTDSNFTHYSIALSSYPQVYNFRFELNKNTVNLVKAKFFYYYIKAIDRASKITYVPATGNVFTAEVITAKTLTLGANGGSIALPNGNPADGQTTIEIPQGAVDGNMDVTITEIDPSDSSVPLGKAPCASVRPVAVYSFGPEHLVFKKFVTMKLLFQDIKHAGVVDGTGFKSNVLKLFWWDGFDWRLLGGKKDPNYNLVTYGNIQHFSMYALFPANALGDNDYRPKEKIITPATVDGFNDFATFTGLVDGDTVNIYDIRGRKIRQLNNGVITWDGKDDDGQMVESGIYIYQIKIKASGKIISGTTVVAK